MRGARSVQRGGRGPGSGRWIVEFGTVASGIAARHEDLAIGEERGRMAGAGGAERAGIGEGAGMDGLKQQGVERQRGGHHAARQGPFQSQ